MTNPPPLRRTNGNTCIGRFINTMIDYPHLPKILVEGDSWFAYPLKMNLAAQVESKLPGAYLRISQNGDTVECMIFGKQNRKLRRYLQRFPLDVILFSGGGNDIVDPKVLPQILREKKAGMSWEDCIDKEAFRPKLERIRAGYLQLIGFRDQYRPRCLILAHGYDYPIPGDRPVRFLGFRIGGPWMYPHMEARKIFDQADKNAIGRWLIEQFNLMLAELADTMPGFVYVDTPGTLNADDWTNEIHPTSSGFEKIGSKVANVLRESLARKPNLA